MDSAHQNTLEREMIIPESMFETVFMPADEPLRIETAFHRIEGAGL